MHLLPGADRVLGGDLDVHALSAALAPATHPAPTLAACLTAAVLTTSALQRRHALRHAHAAGHAAGHAEAPGHSPAFHTTYDTTTVGTAVGTAVKAADEGGVEDSDEVGLASSDLDALDDLHSQLTGVPASNHALGQHPVSGTTALRSKLDPAAGDPRTAPVPRERHTAPAAPAGDPTVAADSTAAAPGTASAGSTGEAVDQHIVDRSADQVDDLTIEVPDLPPGSVDLPVLPAPPSADEALQTTLAALTAAVETRDVDAAAAAADYLPGLAHTAHLVAAAAAGTTAAAVRHLEAALATAPTDLDDTPAAHALRATLQLAVPLHAHHATALVAATPANASLALAAHHPDDATSILAIESAHLVEATHLTLALRAPDAPHELPRRRNDAWGIVYANARRLAGLTPTGPVRAALADLPTHSPDVHVDADALSRDLDFAEALDAFTDGDEPRAAALLRSVLEDDPHYPGAAQLAAVLNPQRR